MRSEWETSSARPIPKPALRGVYLAPELPGAPLAWLGIRVTGARDVFLDGDEAREWAGHGGHVATLVDGRDPAVSYAHPVSQTS